MGREDAGLVAIAAPPDVRLLRQRCMPVHPIGRGEAGLLATAAPPDVRLLQHRGKYGESKEKEGSAASPDLLSLRQMNKSFHPMGREGAGQVATAIPPDVRLLQQLCKPLSRGREGLEPAATAGPPVDRSVRQNYKPQSMGRGDSGLVATATPLHDLLYMLR